MTTATKNLPTTFEAEMQRCLAGGIDTQKADDFLDLLFELAGNLGNIACTLIEGRIIRVQAGDLLLQEAEIPLAKTKLRMLCARLAVRCGEWTGQKTAIYSDVVEVENPSNKRRYKVHFENTTAAQMIEIEDASTTPAAETPES